MTLTKQKKDLTDLESHRRKLLLQYENLKKQHDYHAKADEVKLQDQKHTQNLQQQREARDEEKKRVEAEASAVREQANTKADPQVEILQNSLQ